MKQIKVKGLVIEIYDSIDELPIDQYNLFQCYLLQDIGVNREFAQEMINEANLYISKDMTSEASKILVNYYINIQNKLNQVNLKWLSFGCLLHSINGTKVNLKATGDIENALDKIDRSGITMELINTHVPGIKKNWIPNLPTISHQ